MVFGIRHGPSKTIDRRAWISVGDGSALLNCRLIDISESGAKLEIEDVDEIPVEFSLWLSRHGDPSHSCRVVWCGQGTIGVKFSSAATNRRELLANR
jgi:hypothetical protein